MKRGKEDKSLLIDTAKAQIDESLAYSLQNNIIGSSQVDSQAARLRHELWVTQASLALLGVKPDVLPRYIPFINKPMLPYSMLRDHSSVNRPHYISVIGMPKSLKSYLIMLTREHDRNIGYFGMLPLALGELAGPLKDQYDNQNPTSFNFQAYQQELTFRQASQTQRALDVLRQHDPEGEQYYAIADRDWFDLPMVRANFLVGRYPADFLSYLEQKFDDHVSRFLSQAVLGLMIAFSTPRNSLKREGKDKNPTPRPRRIMNPDFLTKLYAQYLRFHYENLTYAHRTGKSPRFYYAAVNTNAPANIINAKNHQATNWRRYEEILNAMITDGQSWIPS